MRFVIKGGALALVFSVMGAASAQTWQIQALDTPAGIEGHAYGINDNGQVVGYTVDAAGDSHAVMWENGVGHELSYISGNHHSEAYRINNSGQIVGLAWTTDGFSHATYWSGNSVTDLGTLGGTTSFANDINEAGVVVGSAYATHGSHAFTWTAGGGFVDYGSFDSNSNQMFAGFNGINNTGLLVGTGYRLFSPYHATMAHVGDTGITDISEPGQFSTSMAMGVNDAGTIVGYSNHGSGSAKAVIFNGDGTVQDLGSLGLSDSQALDINESGEIVGNVFGLNQDESEYIFHGFYYNNGVMTDLDDLIGAGSGWSIQEAQGINNRGQIVGAGMYNGQYRAFVMTQAVPEPASMAVLGLGVVALLRKRKTGK